MSDWKTIYDGVFFISIATILAGCFGLSIKHCLKSKCEKFSICFGLLEVHRRVDLEVQEEMQEMELGNVRNENNTDDVNIDSDINAKHNNNI